jgi:hypothetical protein
MCCGVFLSWIRTVGVTCTLPLTLPRCLFTPTHNTSTIFLIVTERHVIYFDTSVSLSYILQVLIFPRSFYEKRLVFREMKERNQCAKPAPMILGMELALQFSLVRKCDLRQPNLWLNIPVRWCSAVAVTAWWINILDVFVYVKTFLAKTEIPWIWGFQTAVRCLLWHWNPFYQRVRSVYKYVIGVTMFSDSV